MGIMFLINSILISIKYGYSHKFNGLRSMINFKKGYTNDYYFFSFAHCTVFKILFLVLLPVSHTEAGKTSKKSCWTLV